MSLIKSINTEISGRGVQVYLPEKKTIILKGVNSLHIIHILECLLGQDFTGYYWELDKQYGFRYNEVSGVSSVVFNAGAILGKDKVIQLQGVVPNIHVIRYLNGYTFRSFYLSTTVGADTTLYSDMTKYSHVLQENQWIRLVVLVNSLIGFEFVRLDEESLKFDFRNDADISVDGQKLIYSLLAECFLTPDGYSRVLLLPDMSVLPNDKQVRFLEVLDDIKGHTLTLSTAKISASDVKENSIISFLNV